jgi:hydroxymethylpyrimidine pyrophosphatase-like HAD family hydrolase
MSSLDNRPKTILCDIDGTLVKHVAPCNSAQPSHKMELLPGTIEKLSEWDKKGYNIILISGRREGARRETEKQLSEAGIIYDKLILGVGGGIRHLINDTKPDSTFDTAFSHTIKRNEGIKNLEL